MVPRLSITILQGATFTYPLPLRYVNYAVHADECGNILTCAGNAVPESDFRNEDYTGCTARMQLRRSIDDPEIISERTTENGGIVLAGNILTIKWTAAETSDFVFGPRRPGWCSAIGHVEVIRPNGDVERQYEITFDLDPEGTR